PPQEFERQRHLLAVCHKRTLFVERCERPSRKKGFEIRRLYPVSAFAVEIDGRGAVWASALAKPLRDTRAVREPREHAKMGPKVYPGLDPAIIHAAAGHEEIAQRAIFLISYKDSEILQERWHLPAIGPMPHQFVKVNIFKICFDPLLPSHCRTRQLEAGRS